MSVHKKRWRRRLVDCQCQKASSTASQIPASSIRSLAAETGASIKICPSADMYPGLHDRLLVLIGTLGEQMHALELILLNLSEDPNYVQSFYASHLNPGYNNMSDGPNGVESKFQNSTFQNKEQNICSVTFGVADEHMGIVVGRGGRALIEIGQLTGARVKISDRGDFMPGTSDRKVTISGSPRVVHDAEAMITRKVAFVLRVEYRQDYYYENNHGAHEFACRDDKENCLGLGVVWNREMLKVLDDEEYHTSGIDVVNEDTSEIDNSWYKRVYDRWTGA